MAGKVSNWLELLLRFALGSIFLYAGALHAWDAPGFVESIQRYRILTPDQSMLFGVYLPWVEILAALGLILRRLYLGSLAAIGAMLFVFLGALASAWQRGLDIACGCFGREESIRTHFPELVMRDIVMLAAVGALFVLARRSAQTS